MTADHPRDGDGIGWLRLVERYAFGIWVFCALVAVFRPNELSQSPFRLPIGPRTDTLGAVAFAVAAVVTVPRRWLAAGLNWFGRPMSDAAGEPIGDDAGEPGWRAALPGFLAAVRDLGLAIAVYIGANYLNHPRTMPLPLTHLASWPSERVTGGVAFLVALVANVLLQWSRRSRDG